MSTKRKSLNFILILRDIVRRLDPRRFLELFGYEPLRKKFMEENFDNLSHGRFEVLPTRAIEEDTLKRFFGVGKSKKQNAAQQADGGAALTKTVTSSNYCQMYQEQREQEALRAKTAVDKAAADKREAEADLQKQAQEKKQADDMRFRARQIQDQIIWWQQQSGAGQYNDAVINGTIDSLQRELNSIPTHLWS